MWSVTTLLCVVGTVLVYVLVRHLYLRYKHPLINVVGLSAAVIIIVLLVCGIPYTAYAPAKELMTALIGAATISLALPLYRYRRLLLQCAGAILISVGAGAFVAMLSAGLIAQYGGLPHKVVMSILAKGVSIPFAVEITSIYGGVPPLAAAFVVATGTLGSLLGVWMLNLVGITSPFARGLTLGTISHAQGTAVALQESDEAGAMAGLAMILAGILTAAFAPPVVWLLRAATGFV